MATEILTIEEIQKEGELLEKIKGSALHMAAYKNLALTDRKIVLAYLTDNEEERKKFFTASPQEREDFLIVWRKDPTNKKNGDNLQPKHQSASNGTTVTKGVGFSGGMDNLARRFLLPIIGTELYHLPPEEKFNYVSVVGNIAHLYLACRQRIIIPLLTIIGSKDDKRLLTHIETMAITIAHKDLFKITSDTNRANSSQSEVWARFIAIEYQRDVFGFTATDSDIEIGKMMTAKKDKIITIVASTYCQNVGLPSEEVKPLIESDFDLIMNNLQLEILARINQ